MRKSSLSEAAIRALLDNDIAEGRVAASRANKINRRHYAAQLGCTPSALSRFVPLFAEYERELDLTTGPMRHLPLMREWLTTEYEARRLDVRDGKIDRAAFAERFGLSGGTFMTRHPEIRKLMTEFDMLAARELYLPLQQQKEFDRVITELKSDPVLNKDRMTINLVALAKATGVSLLRLADTRFAEAIDARQAQIMEVAKASKIDPYVHDRIFPFSDLIAMWSTRFLERVGTRFRQIAIGLADAKQPYLQLVAMLRWVGNSRNPNCLAVVADAKILGKVRSPDQWEDALYAYRDSFIARIGAGQATDSATDAAIKQLRIALDGLASGQVIPGTSMPLPGVKHARRRGLHRKSVAEARATSANDTLSGYIDFARVYFAKACKASGTDLGKGEVEDFFEGLAIELRAVPDLPINNPAVAIRIVLRRRLDALQTRASAIVAHGMEARRRGSELLSLARIDSAKFQKAYFGDALNPYERKTYLRTLFPCETADQLELGLGNLLGLIDQRHGGVPPIGGTSMRGPHGQFFAKRYLEYGGLETIAPLLLPSPDVVGAVLTLYLIESGANISVGRTLDRACVEASDLQDHRRITGHKARAQGKPIIVDLPTTSPAVRAMEWLLSANGRLQIRGGIDSDRMFLMQIGTRVQLMTPHWYTNHFKRFAASTPGLQDLRLVPSMIRPSVLLEVALGNDGRLAVGQAIGQHGPVVTQGYQQKWPTRLLYDENIRRFLGAFETLVMSGVEDAAKRLGITVENFEARLGDLRATGLGTFCRNQRGRPGEKAGRCTSLDCWNECPNLLIVAEVGAMTSMQLWQQSLRAARPDWERDRPERWDQVWLPWLCLTDVVEEKMVRGPRLKIWKAAQLRAAEISTSPGYVPHRPF